MDPKEIFHNLNSAGTGILKSNPVFFTQKSWVDSRGKHGSCFAHCVRWIAESIRSGGTSPGSYFDSLRFAGATTVETDFAGRRAYVVEEKENGDDKTRKLQKFFMRDDIKGDEDTDNLQGVHAATKIHKRAPPSLKDKLEGGSSFGEMPQQKEDPLRLILDRADYLYCIHSMGHYDPMTGMSYDQRQDYKRKLAGPVGSGMSSGTGLGAKVTRKKPGHAVATMRYGRQVCGFFDPNVGFFTVEHANLQSLLLAWAHDTWGMPGLKYGEYNAVSTVHSSLKVKS